MTKECTTFQKIFEKWNWKPIQNCPGRYIFSAGVSDLTVSDIAASRSPVLEYASQAVPDKFLVMKFDDGGGIISYRKSAGCFLHTLNDADGLARKLSQLMAEGLIAEARTK